MSRVKKMRKLKENQRRKKVCLCERDSFKTSFLLKKSMQSSCGDSILQHDDNELLLEEVSYITDLRTNLFEQEEDDTVQIEALFGLTKLMMFST